MPQFFLPPEAVAGKTFRIEGEEAFHITRVLRYRPGRTLVLFDGRGGRWRGRIETISPDGAVSGVLTEAVAETESAARLTLYLGLIKAERWEWALEKGTELGVSSFVPVVASRAVVSFKEEGRVKTKLERWNKIAMAAAKQSGAAALPEVLEPRDFEDAMRSCQGAPTLLAWEKARGEGLREALGSLKGGRDVNLFIGPEGGFTDDEVALARSLGARIFGLGTHILRAETAAIAASALVLHELGGLR